MIQDLKGNIRVFCRIRPGVPSIDPAPASAADKRTSVYGLDPDDPRKMEVYEPREEGAGKKPAVKHPFEFDRVFGPDATQEEVYAELENLVQSVLDGYSCCIFAYGQTGSGKTYTMEGPQDGDFAFDEGCRTRGVIPRAVEQLFRTIAALVERGWVYRVEASAVEAYNEQLRDLLVERTAASGAPPPLAFRVDARDQPQLAGCTTRRVTCAEDVYRLLAASRAHRAVAATQFNEYSSRSHSVFRIAVTGENAARRESVRATLNLVDLAGSERLGEDRDTTPMLDRRGAELAAGKNARFKEMQNINLSLLTLRRVITALAEKAPHIPYRDSVLTQLLQPSLGGSAKLLMFVNVSPVPASVKQSIASLRFASKANKAVTGVVMRQAHKSVQ